MLKSGPDKPSAQKTTNHTTAEAGSRVAQDEIGDERFVWEGRVFNLFSIDNFEEEPLILRVDVSTLSKNAYILHAEEGALFESSPPFEQFPPNFRSRETPEEGNPLFISSRFEATADLPGDMIEIPPRRQLNLTMSLTEDCHDRQEFTVSAFVHFGRTRDTGFDRKNALSRPFFQIPSSQITRLKVEVLTPEVHFRPWNLAANRNHFFWNLSLLGRPLFNRPRAQVRVENQGSLPVTITPHLYKVVDKERDAFGMGYTTETLAPRQECLFTLPLWLNTPKDADRVHFEATVEVTSNQRTLLEVPAKEPISAVYHPYRSLPKDLFALFGFLGFCAFGLVWLLFGIPIPVKPEVAVEINFVGLDSALLEKLDLQKFVELSETDSNSDRGSPIKSTERRSIAVKGSTGKSDIQKVTRTMYIFRLPQTWFWNRIPFGWTHDHTRYFRIKVLNQEIPNWPKDFQVIDNNATPFPITLAPPERGLLETISSRFAPPFPAPYGTVNIGKKGGTYLHINFTLNGKAKDDLNVSVKVTIGQKIYSLETPIRDGKAQLVPIEITNEPIPTAVSVKATANQWTDGRTDTISVKRDLFLTLDNFVAPKKDPPLGSNTTTNSDVKGTPPIGQKGDIGKAPLKKTPEQIAQEKREKEAKEAAELAEEKKQRELKGALDKAYAALEQDNDPEALKACLLIPENPGSLAIQSIVNWEKPQVSAAQAERAVSTGGTTAKEKALVLLAEGYQHLLACQEAGGGLRSPEADKALSKFAEASAADPTLAYPYYKTLEIRVLRGDGMKPELLTYFDNANAKAPNLRNLTLFREVFITNPGKSYPLLVRHIKAVLKL